MMNEKQHATGFAVLLIAFAVTMRFVPHPANFAPVTAIALFGGAILPRKLAIWMPVSAMMLSDTFIGFYAMMPITWACYALIALASSFLLREIRIPHVGVLTLASSLFFFAVTNFAVWVSGGMYAHTWSGLIKCYIMALPFFRNTLASDCIYTVLLFGVFAFVRGAVRIFPKSASQDL